MADWLSIVGTVAALGTALIALAKTREGREDRRQRHDSQVERKLIKRTLDREDTAQHQLAVRTDEVIELSAAVADLSAKHKLLEARVEELESQNKSQRERIAALEEERDELRGEIRNLEQQRDLLSARNDRLERDIEALSARETALRERLDAIRREWDERDSEPPDTTYLIPPQRAEET